MRMQCMRVMAPSAISLRARAKIDYINLSPSVSNAGEKIEMLR